MPCLGFSSLSEVYVYATCVLLGISMLMPLNALTSAPRYMVDYYKYVTGDENAVPNSTVFWANILTFYNLASVPTQIIVGPTVLMPWARKLSLTTRFIAALSLMMVEVLVVVVMPVGKSVSQTGAMAAFFIVTIAAGAGKSYLEATCYALVGTMPPKFMSAIMFGCGFSGVIASVLQCIVKVSMDSDYTSVLHQSYIYFSLALGFMLVAMLMAISLRWNRFAQAHVGEFRMLKRAKDAQRHEYDGEQHLAPVQLCSPTHPDHPHDENGVNVTYEPAQVTSPTTCNVPGTVSGDIIMDEDALSQGASGERRTKKDATLLSDDVSSEDNADVVRAVSADDASREAPADQNMTTSEQLQNTKIMPVVKIIYPYQIACFATFLVSLFLFPSMVIPIDRASSWFSTIAILCYNGGDAIGRLSSSLRFLWPSKRVLLTVAGVRVLFIPLIFLCIFGYIPGHAPPFVFMALIGLTGGFFGAVSMVFGPNDARLKTDGQRVMAGQLMGIALLAGASVASLVALLVVLYLP